MKRNKSPLYRFGQKVAQTLVPVPESSPRETPQDYAQMKNFTREELVRART